MPAAIATPSLPLCRGWSAPRARSFDGLSIVTVVHLQPSMSYLSMQLGGVIKNYRREERGIVGVRRTSSDRLQYQGARRLPDEGAQIHPSWLASMTDERKAHRPQIHSCRAPGVLRKPVWKQLAFMARTRLLKDSRVMGSVKIKFPTSITRIMDINI